MGCPLPVYKGGEEEAGRPQGARQGGRNPTPSRSRFPPFLVQLGEEGRRGRGRGKEGSHTPSPSHIQAPLGGGGGGGATSWLLPSLSPKAHNFPGGGPVTLRHSCFIRNS